MPILKYGTFLFFFIALRIKKKPRPVKKYKTERVFKIDSTK